MHENLPAADQLPWTISYVIRKRSQIDTFGEISKDKRPPDRIIWDGTVEDMEDWFDRVFGKKSKVDEEFTFTIDEDEIG